MGGARRGGLKPDRRLSDQAKQQLRDSRGRFCSFAAGCAAGGSCLGGTGSPASALDPSAKRRVARQKQQARELKVTIDLVSSTTEESISQGSDLLSPNKKNKMDARDGEGYSRKQMPSRGVSQKCM
jgi:hypothetical protein